MSIYDNIGAKPKRITIRLTPHQYNKLAHFAELFGKTYQTILSDAVDRLYMEYLDVASGRIDLSLALQNSMQELLNDYVKLAKTKGLIKPPFYRPGSSSSGQFRRGSSSSPSV